METRIAIAGVVSLFGAGTTGTVNWICKPYIVRMWRNTQDHYTAETVNILAKRKMTNFVAADVTQGDNRPFSSFAWVSWHELLRTRMMIVTAW